MKFKTSIITAPEIIIETNQKMCLKGNSVILINARNNIEMANHGFLLFTYRSNGQINEAIAIIINKAQITSEMGKKEEITPNNKKFTSPENIDLKKDSNDVN